MVAAFHGRVEAARELLRGGALAEARTQRGWTAAHFAVMGGDGEAGGVMEALRAARPGVELEVPAAGGLTPRDLAAEMGER
jgi:ankyrin repeat protein